MNKFFGQDNPFWSAMDLLFDLCLLNVLWLLCCLPIFTIGPATTAFYYVQINLSRGEAGYITKDFFRSFKQNFKQGVLLGLLLTVIGAFLIIDICICRRPDMAQYSFLIVFFAIMLLLWSCVSPYAFALLAKFDKSNRQILMLAFVLSIKHLVRTLLMLFSLAAGIFLCRIIPGLVFLLFGLIGRFHAALLKPVFKPYLPE